MKKFNKLHLFSLYLRNVEAAHYYGEVSSNMNAVKPYAILLYTDLLDYVYLDTNKTRMILCHIDINISTIWFEIY